MADNYLEKRMDDYARGRLSSPRASSVRTGSKYPTLTVFVDQADTQGGREVMTAFVQAGCKVCFTVADPSQGNKLAQATGARYYSLAPVAIAEHMTSRGESIDALILLNDITSHLTDALKPAKVVTVQNQTPAGAAILALALAHPEVRID